jgi:hypothetical protein
MNDAHGMVQQPDQTRMDALGSDHRTHLADPLTDHFGDVRFHLRAGDSQEAWRSSVPAETSKKQVFTRLCHCCALFFSSKISAIRRSCLSMPYKTESIYLGKLLNHPF